MITTGKLLFNLFEGRVNITVIVLCFPFVVPIKKSFRVILGMDLNLIFLPSNFIGSSLCPPDENPIVL